MQTDNFVKIPPTLKELIFAGTKFREFRGFWGHPRNLIPAKRKNLTIREIKFFVLSQPRNFIAKLFSLC